MAHLFSKLLKASLATIIVLSSGLFANADNTHSAIGKQPSTAVIQARQRQAKENILLSTPPTLSITKRTMPMRKNVIHFPSPFKRTPPAKAGVTSVDGSKIYGCMIYNSTWTEDYQPYGMYSFNYNDASTLTGVALGDDYVANGGGVYANGKF